MSSGSLGQNRISGNSAVPIDNNQIENLIRPWALGLVVFWASAIMSFIQFAQLSGHDPYASLKDALTGLPTQKARQVEQLFRINGYLKNLRKVHSGYASSSLEITSGKCCA